jgi:hypothetical protein
VPPSTTARIALGDAGGAACPNAPLQNVETALRIACGDATDHHEPDLSTAKRVERFAVVRHLRSRTLRPASANSAANRCISMS